MAADAAGRSRPADMTAAIRRAGGARGRGVTRRGVVMFLAWDAFYDAAQLGLEAQQVIMMRLMKLASGYAAAQGEAVRMIAEKAEVLAAGQIAGALSLARGDSFQTAAAEALGPMRRRLRANHRRLSE